MHTGRRALSVALIGLGALVPSASAAQPGLKGEILSGIPTMTASCNAQGWVGTASFNASGQATGPYPGTFTEQGTYTSTDPNLPEGTIDASFKILSGATTITGTKRATQADGELCQAAGEVAAISGVTEYSVTLQVTRGNPLIATRATYTDRGLATLGVGPVDFFENFQFEGPSQATLVKCELVLVNLIALPLPQLA